MPFLQSPLLDVSNGCTILSQIKASSATFVIRTLINEYQSLPEDLRSQSCRSISQLRNDNEARSDVLESHRLFSSVTHEGLRVHLKIPSSSFQASNYEDMHKCARSHSHGIVLVAARLLREQQYRFGRGGRDFRRPSGLLLLLQDSDEVESV